MNKIEELTKWFEEYGVLIPDGSKATVKDFMVGCEIEIMAEELYEDFIADLQHRLDVAEKALELAIETMRYELGRDAIKNLYKDAMKNLKENPNIKIDKEMCQWFLGQAEKEVKGE